MMESLRTIRALLVDGWERCPPSIRAWAMSPREMLMMIDAMIEGAAMIGLRGDDLSRQLEVFFAQLRAFDEVFGTDDEPTEPMMASVEYDPLATIRKEHR